MAQSESKTVTQIPPALRDLFRSALSASEEELRKINAWARVNARQLIAGEFEIDSVAGEIAVPSGETYRAFRLIGTLLVRGKPIGSIDVDAYATALNEQGGDLSTKARILLDGIQVEPSEAEYARQKGIVSSSILPTLGSIGALCDLRAVFQELPSPSTSQSYREGIGKLLGFEPIVVVNMELNNSTTGDDASYAFQVTEQSLHRMLKTFEDALVQLEVVREYHKKTFVRSLEHVK